MQLEPLNTPQKTITKLRNDTKTNSWWFDHDASILRGVESFGLSVDAMSTIKTKMLASACDTHSVDEMQDRYKSLMHMITKDHTQSPDCESKPQSCNSAKQPFISRKWNLLGGRGTWIASDDAQKLNKSVNASDVALKDKVVTIQHKSNVRYSPKTRRSSRKIQRKVDQLFKFY